MAYFTTANRYPQVKRNQPGLGKEPSILYFLETEILSTGKRSTLNSGERACNKLQWGGVLGIKRLSWRGESMVEKFYSIVVFAKFSCGTYVIVVLNSDIVALINKRNFLFLARWFLAWFCWICRFFLCGFTEFGIPLPPAILIFEHAYTCNSTKRPASIVWCGAQLRV